MAWDFIRLAKGGAMATRAHRRRGESGASAVELALILPLLVLLLFGTMQYGFYFWARSSASAAAREGARESSVGEYATCSALQAFVQGQVGSARGGNTVTTTRTFTKGAGNTGPAAQVGDAMTITVAFSSLDIGLIPLPASGLVTVRAVSRVENVATVPPVSC